MSGVVVPLGTADPLALRRAFGSFASGVTVITVGGENLHGMTASSFTSVSLDPPLMQVSVNQDSLMHRLLTDTGQYAISVLADTQEAAAKHFARKGRVPGEAQFDAVDWTPGRYTGAPLLVGALAHFECDLWRAYEGGDHTIFVGRLLSLHRTEGEPLLVHSGQFRDIAPVPERTELAA